jgi:hypothetical protein
VLVIFASSVPPPPVTAGWGRGHSGEKSSKEREREREMGGQAQFDQILGGDGLKA